MQRCLEKAHQILQRSKKEFQKITGARCENHFRARNTHTHTYQQKNKTGAKNSLRCTVGFLGQERKCRAMRPQAGKAHSKLS